MIKSIDKIYQSNIPPKQTNVIWDDGGILKLYRNGEWKPLSISEEAVNDVLTKVKSVEQTLQSGLVSSYLHTAYANSADGSKDFSIIDSAGRAYLGIYSDFNSTPSKNYKDYKWTKIKGEKGEKGDAGINGTNGVDGAAGTNTYFHIKYSNNPNGVPMNDFEGDYMGTYVDEILEDSNDASKYKWVKIKGENGIPGEQGIPGSDGKDGKTSYLHIAYANSPDGLQDFSVTDAENKIYVGQYVDFEQYDSYDHTKYKWSRLQGVKGDPAIQFYTWLRYADTIEFDFKGNPVGGTGMSNSPMNEDGIFKPYMGLAYDQVVPEESDDYTAYKWTKIQGKDGIDGVNGYTWIAYADKLPETPEDTIYQTPTEKTEYIGIAPNKNTKEESSNPDDYTWSKFKGDQGIQGEKGEDGLDGKSYEYIYRLTKDENDVPNINGLPSENVDEYVPSGWEDNPTGVSSELRAEWCCTRIKDPKTKMWGGWRGPSLWSSYGKEGKDGGDLQYVYKRTSVEIAPDNPTPQDYLTSDHYQEKGEYLGKEFVPIGWTDEPVGVNEYNPYEWTALRKKVDGKWRDYKGPSLWAKYGKDGKDGTSIRIKGYVETIYDLPSMPEDANDCYVVGNNLFIWDKTYWKDAGPFKGENGDDGISIEWKGTSTSHPQDPKEGWAYRNTNGITYIFRNGTWNIMVTDGEASYVLELSNDADSVNCDYDGKIVDNVKPNCTASLYKGTNKLDSGVSFTITLSDSSAKGITINGNGSLEFSDGYTFKDKVLRVTIYATHGTSTISKVFTLSKNIPGNPGEDATKWFLNVNSTVIVKSKEDTLTPSKIIAKCYKQVGAKDPVEDTTVNIYWGYDTEQPTISTISGTEITLKKDFSFITFALKNNEGKFYEIEKISLVKDGKDGSDGTSINVKGSLNSVGDLPKTPENPSDCYIINKDLYVWDGTEWYNVGQFKGEDGESRYLHVAYANSEDGEKDFSTTDDTGRKYIGQYVDDVEDDSISPDDYKWKKYVGTGINSVIVSYGISPNMVDVPTEWYSNIPEVPKGNYLWTKTLTDYTDPDVEDTVVYGYSYQATDGKSGSDGVAGAPGVGIKSTSITYGISDSETSEPITYYPQVPTLVKGKYLWTKTVWTYTDKNESQETGYSKTYISKDGNDGSNGQPGKDGTSILTDKTQIHYCAHSSGVDKPSNTANWTPNVPSVPDGYYLWTRTTYFYSDNTDEYVYTVSRMGPKGDRGPQGEQGIEGPKGKDGTSRYFHIAYASDSNGNGYNQSGGKYVSTYVDDVEKDEQSKFNAAGWKLFEGAQGPQGNQGIPGTNGKDGETYYLHIGYATDENGNGFSHDYITGRNLKYIGQYTDTNKDSSNVASDYEPWVKYIGDNGKDGVDGKDGVSNYFHIAYANDANGNGYNQTGGEYVATYVDTNPEDVKSKFTNWKPFRGAQGADGAQGIPGKNGENGQTTYLHIAYAKDDKGTGFNVNSFAGASWMGTYTDFYPNDSTDYLDYKWVEVKGEQGPEGPQGPQGNQGIQGPVGEPGKSGNGIKSVTVKYSRSTSYYTPGKWQDTPPQTTTTYKYLWQQQVITFTDETSKTIQQVVATHGNDGVSVVSITTFYYASNNVNYVPEIGSQEWKSDPTHPDAIITTSRPYLYTYTSIQYSNGQTINSKANLAGHYGKNGTNGKNGSNGKTVYPAGQYDKSITYTCTDLTAPYVIYDGEYYQLNVSSWTGNSQTYKNPKDDIAEGNKNWVKFEKFEALFAKIALIDNGTFGSAVFHGDYMFSKQGVDFSGNNTTKNEYFNPDHPVLPTNAFNPNVCINFSTGEFWFGQNKITFTIEGNKYIAKLGDFEITKEGLTYTTSSGDGDHLLEINSSGIKSTLYDPSEDDTYVDYSLNPEGTCSFCKDNISFNHDGTWSIGSKIYYNGDKVVIGGNNLGTEHYNDGTVINKNQLYYNLYDNGNSCWPPTSTSASFILPLNYYNDVYISSGCTFTDYWIDGEGAEYDATVKANIFWKENRMFTIHVADDLNTKYWLTTSFSNMTTGEIYRIAGIKTLLVTDDNGAEFYIENHDADGGFSIDLYCGKSYVFKCFTNRYDERCVRFIMDY